jgi:hypothetical protein
VPPCLRCGANLVADAHYCIVCGAPTAAPSAPPPPAAYMPGPTPWPGAPTGVSNRRPLPVLLGLVGIVVVLVAGAAIWRGSGDGPVDATTMPPATTALSGEAIVGATHEIGSETSEPGQDTTLRAPADGPLAGMTIAVPGDAYAEQTAFTVSARDLRLTGYDGKITALTDLIVIENGGAYATSPMTVTIPVQIPTGSFAMGLYLREDGALEPMPLVDETPSSVTVLSRHFSSFFVAAIAEAALPDDIGTGFRAGEDDIQAANYGSYIAPHGYCDGQSLAELWYFAERRAAGAPQLWGLTDNNGKGATTSFWEDDSNAYRLGAVIHHDTDYETLSATIELAFEKAKVDQLQWDAFRYAMLITGQPQFVGLSVGNDPGGHVVVAYAATRTGLWVADPNYPGALRDIAWDERSKGFKPYDSGASATSSKEHYDRIAFYGKTALVDWAAIGARWAEVDSGTIGSRLFPLPVLSMLITNPDGTQTYSPMRDGPIGTTTLSLQLTSPDASVFMQASFYDGTRMIGSIVSGTPGAIVIGDGITDLGVYIQGLDMNDIHSQWSAVDFYHFTLTAPPPSSIVPATPSPAPPTAAPPTAPPAANPTSAYDCSKGPPDSQIGRMEWELRCTGIPPTAGQ